jgi:peptidoglycan/xylan/chitin deacetylase (PgdA/CDA1 family)
LAILGYHKIGEPPDGWWTWNYVPEAIFADQLSVLLERGWTVIDHRAFLLGLDTPQSLPHRSALITFDDGYRSFAHTALPVLRRFGFPAVIFVPTCYVGGTNSFDRDIEPEEEICDWNELMELENWRVSVQSHGVTHQGFSELDPQQLREELVRSKVELELGLAKSIETFSFPYGDDGREPDALRNLLMESGYRAACLYGGGVNSLPGANRYRLTRLAMGPDIDLAELLDTGRVPPNPDS